MRFRVTVLLAIVLAGVLLAQTAAYACTTIIVGKDRTADVGQIGKVSDLYANPADETRVRQVETWSGGVADPRIDIVPSGFGAVPGTKIGVRPPVFHEVNPFEIGARAEDGFTPYSHHPKP
jgi:hypothetical protein